MVTCLSQCASICTLFFQTTEPTGGCGKDTGSAMFAAHAVVALSYNNAKHEQQLKQFVFAFISQHTCRKLSGKLFFTYIFFYLYEKRDRI